MFDRFLQDGFGLFCSLEHVLFDNMLHEFAYECISFFCFLLHLLMRKGYFLIFLLMHVGS